MSSNTSTVVDVVPGGEAIHGALYSYGLGIMFAANVFGAGSVYILADTGANFAFALLWVIPLAFLIDISLHDMSARLAVEDEPLADYIIDVLPVGGRSLIIAYFVGIANVLCLLFGIFAGRLLGPLFVPEPSDCDP